MLYADDLVQVLTAKHTEELFKKFQRWKVAMQSTEPEVNLSKTKVLIHGCGSNTSTKEASGK